MILYHIKKIAILLIFSTILIADEIPTAPSNLHLTPTNNSVEISWVDNSSNERGFKIYRDGVLINIAPANSTKYVDSGLQSSTTYKYTVKATTDKITKTGHEYQNNLTDKDQGNVTLAESVENDPTVSTVKGTLSIEQGKAQYSIPIPVAPGRAGMEPKLSIEYNSQGGNGYLGKGWGLGGLSTITRCPSTKSIDSKVRAINLDSADNYCLNGQRLISIGNNEYKTELDNYSKIVAISSSSEYSPESWRVYTKDGLIYEYGEVASDGDHNSRVIANYRDIDTKYARDLSGNINSHQTVISWAVNKISDRTADGNSIDFYYKMVPDSLNLLALTLAIISAFASLIAVAKSILLLFTSSCTISV